jgi:hypothetical protein
MDCDISVDQELHASLEARALGRFKRFTDLYLPGTGKFAKDSDHFGKALLGLLSNGDDIAVFADLNLGIDSEGHILGQPHGLAIAALEGLGGDHVHGLEFRCIFTYIPVVELQINPASGLDGSA